jgi:hypothetical protein
MWDPILVNGIISGLGAAVAIFGWAARRMVNNFDVVTVNNTKQTEHLGVLAAGVSQNTARLESLEKTVRDDRQTQATKAQEMANAAMRAALALVTGKALAPIEEEGDEEPEAAPQTVRRRDGSRPR